MYKNDMRGDREGGGVQKSSWNELKNSCSFELSLNDQ